MATLRFRPDRGLIVGLDRDDLLRLTRPRDDEPRPFLRSGGPAKAALTRNSAAAAQTATPARKGPNRWVPMAQPPAACSRPPEGQPKSRTRLGVAIFDSCEIYHKRSEKASDRTLLSEDIA